MNKKYLTLLAENHRGGSCTRPHGPRGNAVLHALRVRAALGRRSVQDGIPTQSVGTG